MTSDGARTGPAHFFLNALRIVTALLFIPHGAQKLFAVLGADQAAATFSLRWFAGVLEFYGGFLILFGIFTRPVAVVLAGEMMVAYFRSHAPRDLWPILNGGELSALYCFIYLFFAANGGGRFSVDGLLAARRRNRLAG